MAPDSGGLSQKLSKVTRHKRTTPRTVRLVHKEPAGMGNPTTDPYFTDQERAVTETYQQVIHRLLTDEA
ncbi:MAG: hypothetical protein KJO69_07740 [Gammaproteobacteria bacterium]|nr:hypothetical protein [Gammaproteobacteria bacterium]